MIFYRYQNTKTLETNSQYADMRRLYNEVIYQRDYFYSSKNISPEFIAEKLYDEFSKELVYRKNLKESEYKNIILQVCKIAVNSELKDLSIEIKAQERRDAYKKIDNLMKPYPLDGIFVIPEYSEECKYGTKYSISELRSKIICNIGAPSVKYLAVYAGEIIKDEMVCGGTLIRPTRILGTRPLFKEAIKSHRASLLTDIFYRDIKDGKQLENAIKFQKSFLEGCIKYAPNSNILKYITFSHIRELIILNALKISRCDYKDLEYRFKNNRHLIEISKNNKMYKFCIFNEKVTATNLLNNDCIKYKGFYIEDDLFNNITNKKPLYMKLVV